MAGALSSAACRADLRVRGDASRKLPERDMRLNSTQQVKADEGRLLARPAGRAREKATAGLHALGFGGKRDGLVYVPASYTAERPAPLAVMLHGAGGIAEHGMSLLRDFADLCGLILLAPASRAQTWDVILGGYAADVAFIDRALEQTFSSYNIDSSHLSIGGFSDGASYALSLGLTNGDLFTHVIAFSPGFAAPGASRGTPRLFISHGTDDKVLPINACSRRIVPQVKRAGYDVTYQEFDGEHTIPQQVRRTAIEWFLATDV